MSYLAPAQIFAFYHTRLTELLTQHNPAGLNTIDALLRQFPDKEHQVYVQICKKCGVDPVDRPTIDDFENGAVKPLVKAPEDARVIKWLYDNGFERSASKQHFKTMTLEELFSISTRGQLIELGVLPRNATVLLSALLRAREEDGKLDKPLRSSLRSSRNKADFEIGENCYTKIVMSSNKGGEKWLNARVTNVNDDNSFDIYVYNSNAFNVPPEAVNVPRDMLKKLSEHVDIAHPRFKRKSMKRPQFQSGDRVRVFGLRSHKSYNGLYGTVLLYVPSERRYQVRLDTNDIIAIKQRNVAPPNSCVKEPAVTGGRGKPNRAGAVEKTDEVLLSELMAKLMQDNPNTDPGKLGEFAAGYLLARQKLTA